MRINGKKIKSGNLTAPHSDCSGQAISEFTVMLVLFIGVAFAMVVLMKAFMIYGWRILDLVGSDIP
jgi:hypothetical protein